MHTRKRIAFLLSKWSSRATIAGVLSLALMLLVTTSVFAYHLEGPRWYGTPHSKCCAHVLVNVQGSWHTVDRTGLNNAVKAWNASPANVILTQNHTGALTIQETSRPSVSWDGLTNYAWSTSNGVKYFTYAHVYINYHYTHSYPAGATQGVVVHELGHALGLAHTNGCVIMTPGTSERWFTCHIDTPRTDDINGINKLY